MKIFNLKQQTGENTSPNNRLPLVAGVMDNNHLSKNHASGKAKPQLLAFFVSKNRLATQTTDNNDTTHLPPFTGVNRHIFNAHSVTSYGGVILQNKTAFRQICRAVACVTESEPRHPMNFHSVVLTQNTTQGVAING